MKNIDSPPPPSTLWQAGRAMPALAPGYYKLDDRKIDELAVWAVKFAGLLTYFDDRNIARPVQKGQMPPWASFFVGDISFLLADISRNDPSASYRAGLANSRVMEAEIERYVHQLDFWRRRAEELAIVAPPDSVEAALNGTLQRASENELKGALPWRDRESLVTGHGDLPCIWFSRNVHYDDRKALFSLLNRVTGQIVSRAKDYLRRSLQEKADHPAQTGLFLAFLELLRKSQVDLNGLTERHLEFYYRRVLRLMPRAATPDCAHLAFDLSPESPGVLLPKGTAVIAGSASVPDPTVFLTDRTVSLNRIRIAAIRAIRVTRSLQSGATVPEVQAVQAFPDAASADGFGLALPPGVTSWPTFGPETATARSEATIGVAFEASELALSEGTRQITLNLGFAATREWTFNQALDNFCDRIARFFPNRQDAKSDRAARELLRVYVARALRLEIVTSDGNVTLQGVTADLGQRDDNRLILRGTLAPDAPPINAPPGHTAPLLSVTLNPDAPVYGYDLLAGAVLDSARIDISVSGMRTLDIAGPYGPIDPKKPFAPFGQIPAPGDAFYLSNPELTQDSLRTFCLTLDWTGLPVPPATFASNYAGYGVDLTASSFCVRVSRSDGQAWHPLPAKGNPPATTTLPMFTVTPPPDERAEPQSAYDVERVAASPDTPLPRVGAPQRPGALKIEMTNPPEGFGQTLYPALVSKVAIANAQGKKARKLLPKALQPGGVLEPPNPPLLPLVEGICAAYTSTVRSDRLTRPDSAIRLFQYHPLGALTPCDNGRMIGARCDFDGMLLLGLDAADPPETLTLLFDIDDLVAPSWMPGGRHLRPALHWTYFNGSVWRDLDGDAVQLDETDGLTTHGILRLALPGDLAPGPDYPGGLCWIALRVDGDVRRYGQMRQILPQAVSATRLIAADDTRALAPLLPAGAITRLAQPLPAILKVLQPYATQGGRAAENSAAFHQRVSERLSHKQRAIMPRDYTRIVLEAFPEIGQVACLTHLPGQVEVIVTPRRDTVQMSGIPPLVPLHLRLAISTFLKGLSSDGAIRPIVRNPLFETLRVSVQLAPGPDASSALLHLVEIEIDRLIAAWLFDPDAPMPIGQARLAPSTLQARIERMPEVERVVALSIVQIYRLQGTRGDVLYGLKDTARGAGLDTPRTNLLRSTPRSVFVPADNHRISFLGPRHGIGDLRVGEDFYIPTPEQQIAFEANPDLIPTLPAPLGIGSMAIGTDFIPMDPDDLIAPPDTAISAFPASDAPLLTLSELD